MDFTVINLNDSGTGSLRWAIDQANARIGFDTISFDNSLAGGTIALGTTLAALTDRVAINGLVGDQNTPQIAIDFNQANGLIFSGKRAAGSSLKGLALVDASGDGLTLNANGITVQNNYIGLGKLWATGL